VAQSDLVTPVAAPSITARAPRWAIAVNGLGVVAVMAGVLVLTYLYTSAEHTFYTWDFHEYTTRLETTYSQLTRSPLTALVQVYLSTSQEYNLIPTIPLLPLREVLGGSRLAYELDVAAVFIVPFVLAVGWIGSRILPGPRTVVFWTTVLIALAIPYTWVSIMRGFADVGAAALVAIAIGLYVGDPRLKRLWRPVAIGVLLALAFLFRRPFAYDAVAFGAALGLIVVGRAAIASRAGVRPAALVLAGDLGRLALIVVAGLVTLVGIGHRLLGKLLLEDYGTLYQGYVQSAADVLVWLGTGFGWLVVGLAISGFLLLWRAGLRGQGLLFVAIYGIVLTVIWAAIVGQEDVHYAAHFVVPVAIGLAAFAWALWRILPARLARPSEAALVVLLVVNLVAGLSPAMPGGEAPARALLAVNDPPLVRTDYDEMIRLVRDVRSIAGMDTPILVIGSTDGFSDDTILVADEVSRGDVPPLFVLTSPHVDSRDQYPLAVLLAADIVVLPDPLPLALAADRQGVQRVLHDMFATASPAVAAFRMLPGSYLVEGGIEVRLLERVRPTTLDEAIAALALMRQYTPDVPGNQEPWINVGGLAVRVSVASGDRPPVISAGRDADGRWVANSLLYVGVGTSTMIGGTADFLDRTCAGLVLRLSSLGGALPAGAATSVRLEPSGPGSFQITDLTDGVRDLLMTPEQLDSSRPCTARITFEDAAGDRAAAKSLLIDDQQSGGDSP
jgi:hypothetical protein